MPHAFIFDNITDNSYQARTQIDNSIKVIKTGKSCTKNILGIASFGDSSIEAAKEDGKISNVAFYERESFNFLSIYIKGCTVVRGN